MTEPATARSSLDWRTLLAFALAYVLLQWAYASARSSAGALAVIDHITVQPAAWLLSWLAPAEGVVTSGARLVWPQGSLGLRMGCDGFEVITLFVAAAVAAPLAWPKRLVLALLGFMALWALNQSRVLGLYAAFRHQREWFDALHTVWAPLLLVLAAAMLYVGALRFLQRTAAGHKQVEA